MLHAWPALMRLLLGELALLLFALTVIALSRGARATRVVRALRGRRRRPPGKDAPPT